MADEPGRYEIQGRVVKCSHCGNDSFYTRESLLSTKGAAFFKLDWMNQAAENYICSQCGHIEWFHPMED